MTFLKKNFDLIESLFFSNDFDLIQINFLVIFQYSVKWSVFV